MPTIKLLIRVILVFCLIGITLFDSACTANQPISSNNEKGYGGEGR